MKEHLRTNLGSFFICVTLINVAMFVLGRMLEPDLKFGYEAFAYPLIYGVIGSIPGLVMYSKKELTMKQTIIREIIQMFLVIAVIIGFMFGRFKFIPDVWPQIIGVSISVMIIYVLVHVFGWLIDLKTANIMMEDLKKFQERASVENK
ncbi:hypothetical protein SAMN02910264_01070 [Ruminococcaceae bacterium YAD3003]|jgi:hypothetical protein|nr:hypothetical protein SAMN02910264_01070 [Ruminococcaceae bacterium YAD3003]